MRIVRIGPKKNLIPENIGDYELLELNLISPPYKKSNGEFLKKKISIVLLYSNFSIYENIYSNCLTGSITILDANHLFTEFPIVGEETVEFIFRSINTHIAIHLQLRVTGISTMDKINENTNVYTLLLTSAIAIKGEKQKISRSFYDGKTHEMVKHICEKYLNMLDENNLEYNQVGDYYVKDKQIENNYFTIESKSGHYEKYVSPYHSPFRIINTLCKRSINENGTLYFFFQDINRFRFINLEETIKRQREKTNIKKLIYFPNDALDRYDSKYLRLMWNIVYDYRIKKRFDVFQNMAKGMYSSEVIFLDVEKRRADTINYYYQKDGAKYNHITENGLLNTKYSDMLHDYENGETPATLKFVTPIHYGDSSSQDYTIHRDEYTQRRLSMTSQMDSVVLEVEIPGDSSGEIELGDVIEFSFATDSLSDPTKQEDDYYLSGKYMVTKIHHHVSKDTNYRMIIEMVSDSVANAYDSFAENEQELEDLEPSALGANSVPISLNQDQTAVLTANSSNILCDAVHAIDRKRRITQTYFEDPERFNVS